MKILVTGATGLVGRYLLPVLRDKGHEITIVTRNAERAAVRLPVHCRIVPWDPYNEPVPRQALDGVEGIVSLAGAGVADGRWTEKRKRKLVDSRILLTRKLVEAIKDSGSKPSVLVSASAVGFYGDRGEESLTESSPKGEGFLSDLCRDWEREVRQVESLGMRPVSLRLGMVLGHDGGALQKMLPPFRLGAGGPLGGGRQWMSWIHARDVADLIAHALETPELEGPVNAVSPKPARNKEFSSLLGSVLSRPAFLPAPGFAIKLLLGEMSQILLASQKVSAKKALESGFKFMYPDLRTALRVICDRPGHELLMEQWIPQPAATIFGFFVEAKNLERITPEFVHFKIVNTSTNPIEDGTRLDYTLRLHGVPFRWRSIISDWVPGKRFSDRQAKGPYAYWYHTHEFIENDGGTIIRDRAVYRVPFGVLGDLVAHPFVRKDLEKIFIFRRKKIEELFGK